MQASDIVRIVAAHLDEGEDIPLAALPTAVPFFFIRLTTICVERRDIGVVREFILRALQLGFSSVSSVSAFLGISSDDVDLEIQQLLEESFVSETGGAKRLSLLQKGIAAISLQGLSRVAVREAACYFDGVKRAVDVAPGELTPRRRLSGDTFVLPAVPARAPRISEIDVHGVKTAIAGAKNQLPRVLEVTRLGRVIRTSSLFLNAFILLRRGAHRVPLICVDGSADENLAQILGGHPAIQDVKSLVEKHERMVKRALSQQLPLLSTVKQVSPALLREALVRFVSFTDADPTKSGVAEKEFIQSVDGLVQTTHWIGAQEAEVLFAHAVLTAKNRLVVVAPPLASSLFRMDTLEGLQLALRRGVEVEVHFTIGDERFSEHENSIRSFLKTAKFFSMSTVGGWCGFSCDSSYEVIAAAKVAAHQSGRSVLLFGAVVSESNGVRLLRDVAITSGAPVSIKPKRRAFSLKNETPI